jgi:hypothetical protein
VPALALKSSRLADNSRREVQPPAVVIAPASPPIDFMPHGCNGYIGGGGGFQHELQLRLRKPRVGK